MRSPKNSIIQFMALVKYKEGVTVKAIIRNKPMFRTILERNKSDLKIREQYKGKIKEYEMMSFKFCSWCYANKAEVL